MMIVGMLTWWWPGLRAWGALAGGLMVVFALWLTWRTVCGNHTIQGNWLYLVLLVPAAIFIYHLARTGLGTELNRTAGLAGALNVSMLFHIGLAALAIMLSSSLLGSLKDSKAAIFAACGAAMVGGPSAAMIFQYEETAPIHTALTLLSFGGIGLWLCSIWAFDGSGENEDTAPPHHPRHTMHLKIACAAIGIIAAAFLACVRPSQAVIAGIAAGVVLIFSGAVLPARRKALLAWGAILVSGACVLAIIFPPNIPRISTWQFGLFGLGEQAAGKVSPADGGLVIVARTVGLIGLAWLLVGAVVYMAAAIVSARKSSGARQGSVAVWAASTAVVSCSLLAPGGLAVPAASLAVAFMWGMLGSAAGKQPKIRSGIFLLAAMAVIFAAMGLARSPGLGQWSAMSFGAGQNFLHIPTGFFLAMVMAWLMGARGFWFGILGIVLAGLAGGAGEALQYLASRRGADMLDWGYHAIGSAAAIVPYLLCVGSRMCESPEARDIRELYQ